MLVDYARTILQVFTYLHKTKVLIIKQESVT